MRWLRDCSEVDKGRNMRATRTYLPAFLILAIGFGFYQNASATPLIGQQIYYEGGPIEITVFPFEASYTNSLYLFSGANRVFIANNKDVGSVITLQNLQALNIVGGDELVFAILVNNTGDTFVTGPAGNNPDNFAHAFVDYAEGQNSDTAILGFEDLWNGGDKDFNDAVFRITGGIGLEKLPAAILAVPEPASVFSLLFGLISVAFVIRRRNQS
jgi:uncharacterized protein DUF4114